jgi:dTDP-4-dehydrorhamnose reductase
MKIWVTGAGGLLGSALKKRAALATTREVDIGDLSSLRAFVKQHKEISHIVNCAAFSLVDPAESRREEAHRANAVGPENLAKVAKEIGAKLLHLSTDYVFPGDLKRPLKETDPTEPLNHYGKTKLEGEERAMAAHPAACILRVSWLFGSGGKNFVSKLLQMFQEQEEIRLTADQWGRPTYVPDLVEAILKILDQSGLYHYANAGAATKFTFGCAMRDMAEQMGFPLTVKSIVAVPGASFPSPCKRPPYSVFDTAKIEQFVNVRPWQEALKEFLCKRASS